MEHLDKGGQIKNKLQRGLEEHSAITFKMDQSDFLLVGLLLV